MFCMISDVNQRADVSKSQLKVESQLWKIVHQVENSKVHIVLLILNIHVYMPYSLPWFKLFKIMVALSFMVPYYCLFKLFKRTNCTIDPEYTCVYAILLSFLSKKHNGNTSTNS